MLRTIFRSVGRVFSWALHVISSSIILAVLIFIIVDFYIFASIVNLDSFFYAFLILSLLTDGLLVFIHIPRRRHTKRKLSFDPQKLTVVIACHNGEDVIRDTVVAASTHVPLKQIIVVDDASTDSTAMVAKATGARVISNEKNLHKVGSINAAIAYVRTPYVLILDDDTLIDKAFIPTNLLDDGYTAVAFNVMPQPKKTLLNELQRFEYRNTMQMGKNLRSSTGAIGNISGAIGLYRTDDLRNQITLHSGQFAGEDEQRTLLAHMYGRGKGITYTDTLVITKAPATYLQLFKQRAFSWSLAAPELFTLYLRILVSPKHHYLLKAEKAYLLYIFITEPLRMLFLWTLILRPSHLLIAYCFYLALNTIVWLRLGCKDTLRALILTPLYTLSLSICRFIGYFYWLKVKAAYLAERSHRHVKDRMLLIEYALVLAVIVASWAISLQHFRSDLHLFYSINTSTLDDNASSFNYDSSESTSQLINLNDVNTSDPNSVPVFVEPGDNLRALAHKAIDICSASQPNSLFNVTDYQRWEMDMWLANKIPVDAVSQPGMTLGVSRGQCLQAIQIGKGVPAS